MYSGDQRERQPNCPGVSADAPQNALLAMLRLIDALGMRTTMGSRQHTTWVTSAVAPVDHAVTDDAMAAGIAARAAFVAVCGARFFSAPMAAAPGPVCTNCRRFVVARASSRPVEQRMAGRRVPARAGGRQSKGTPRRRRIGRA